MFYVRKYILSTIFSYHQADLPVCLIFIPFLALVRLEIQSTYISISVCVSIVMCSLTQFSVTCSDRQVDL